MACQKGHPDAIMALVAARASIDQQTNDSFQPIEVVAIASNYEDRRAPPTMRLSLS